MQTSCDDSHRTTAGDSTRDVFAFGQREYLPRAATNGRRNPTVSCQNEVNDYVVFTQSTADLI
jgi:hypothetical protein